MVMGGLTLTSYKINLASTFNENKKWVGSIFSSNTTNPGWMLEYETHCDSEYEMYKDIKITIKQLLESDMEDIKE